MQRKIGVGHFEPTEEMRILVNEVLDSGRISYGPLCRRLEDMVAELHESEWAAVSASGTDALRAGLHAMKIFHEWKDGSKVLLPATTFVATANIVNQVGLRPVLVDIEDRYYGIDVEKVEAKIRDEANIVAIIPVNLLGQSADLCEIYDICDDYGLAMMEDSAESMFVKHMGKPVGGWGDVSAFSFYMAHLVTAGVGGATVGHNLEIEQIVRSLLNHGREPIYISIDDDKNLDDESFERVVASRFKFIHPGYSSRMTELQAAIALPQLLSWRDMLASRQAVARELTACLSKHACLQLPAEREQGEHAYMMYGIRVCDPKMKKPLVMHLEKRGIETRDIPTLIGQPIFSEWHDGDPDKDFPVSTEVANTGFYIGCHHGISGDDINYICSAFDDFFKV